MNISVQFKVAGIPFPETEYLFMPHPKTGKRRLWRFDYCWPEYMLALEIEGGAYVRGRHVRPQGFLGDLTKYGEAFALGWSVLRCSPQMLEDGTAVRWLLPRIRPLIEAADESAP